MELQLKLGVFLKSLGEVIKQSNEAEVIALIDTLNNAITTFITSGGATATTKKSRRKKSPAEVSEARRRAAYARWAKAKNAVDECNLHTHAEKPSVTVVEKPVQTIPLPEVTKESGIDKFEERFFANNQEMDAIAMHFGLDWSKYDEIRRQFFDEQKLKEVNYLDFKEVKSHFINYLKKYIEAQKRSGGKSSVRTVNVDDWKNYIYLPLNGKMTKIHKDDYDRQLAEWQKLSDEAWEKLPLK